MAKFRLMGPMARYTGYAVGFRGLVRKLATKPDIQFQLRASKGVVPDDTEEFFLKLISRNGDFDRLGVVVGFPTLTNDLPCRYISLYSMYEADNLPEAWKGPVGRAEEVWVPSRFCYDVFRRYNPRTRIVPWGIDTDVFRKPKRKPKNEEFTFGSVGVQSPRKGTDVLLKAFDAAFGGRPGVRLIIKTRDTRQLPSFDNDQVAVIDADWPEEKLVEFMQGLDCLVESSRGEGQGMPPLQAAACGVPSLVTAWGGMLDYADGKGVYPIRIKGLSSAKNIGAKNANWAEPDPNHLAELMQWAVDTRPRVTGDYSRWSLQSMANEFHTCVKQSWQAAIR